MDTNPDGTGSDPSKRPRFSRPVVESIDAAARRAELNAQRRDSSLDRHDNVVWFGLRNSNAEVGLRTRNTGEGDHTYSKLEVIARGTGAAHLALPTRNGATALSSLLLAAEAVSTAADSITVESDSAATPSDTAYDHPCTADEVARYAKALRRLLAALGGEIVAAALVGEGKSDLLHPVGQEVDRVREFLHGRISLVSVPSDLRSRGLAVLDALADEFESAAVSHDSSPVAGDAGAHSVGDGAESGEPAVSGEPDSWREYYGTRAARVLEDLTPHECQVLLSRLTAADPEGVVKAYVECGNDGSISVVSHARAPRYTMASYKEAISQSRAGEL